MRRLEKLVNAARERVSFTKGRIGGTGRPRNHQIWMFGTREEIRLSFFEN